MYECVYTSNILSWKILESKKLKLSLIYHIHMCVYIYVCLYTYNLFFILKSWNLRYFLF